MKGGNTLPSDLYDVIVVGAGPSGSHVAYELASLGYKVAVLEQKRAPGMSICCTGIISQECFDSFGITPDVILARASSAKFFTPSGKWLRLETERVQAYVVDRASFDQAVAAKAQSQGADCFFSSRVSDIAIKRDCAEVEALCSGLKEIFKARAVVLANGFNAKLCQRLGMGRITHFAIGAQAEVETDNIDEIEIYFSQQIAPGFFAWLVPTKRTRALVGVIASSHARLYLNKLLVSSFCQGKVVRGDRVRQKLIPLGTLPRTYGDRVLVVGDAAGQVKPSTGGGIYFGHLCAQMAAEVLSQALTSGDLTAAYLSRYQKGWKAKIGKELSIGYRARQLYSKLSDRRIEQIFQVIGSDGIAESWLRSPDFSLDWHGKLIIAALRHGIANHFNKPLYIPELRTGEASLDWEPTRL